MQNLSSSKLFGIFSRFEGLADISTEELKYLIEGFEFLAEFNELIDNKVDVYFYNNKLERYKRYLEERKK